VTDEDLYLLHREEVRLYNAYIDATNGRHRLNTQAISAKQVSDARDAWIALHRKLREALPPAERRRILQAVIKSADNEARRAK
jgi:hypothetical protein